MQAWRSFVAAGCILSTVLAVGGRVARGAPADERKVPKGNDAEYRLLDALNERIQERFKRLDDRRFGYARVATVRSIPHTFDAESIGETTALRDLERAQLRVVMYLAGRRVLRADTSIADSPTVASAKADLSTVALAQVDPFAKLSLIKGPVVVTPPLARLTVTDGVTAFPAPLDLLDDSRGALLAFTEVESTEFARDGWKFVARPVRASDGVCFSCHRESSIAAPGNALRIGDPLGVVLYGYQPIR
jgi:hypothetical protein